MSARFRYSTPLVIPDVSDAKDQITNLEISYIFNALRTMAVQLDAVTGALSPLQTEWPGVDPVASVLGNYTNKFYAICAADIAYGAFVNFYNLSATRVQARPAQANGFAKAAAGFCATPGGFLAGQWGEFVVGPGINPGIGGMTPGNWYFLDPASALGIVTAVQPTVVGDIIQLCGIAVRDDRLLVGALNNWIQL